MGRGNGVTAASESSIKISFAFRGVRCRETIQLPPTPANLKYVQRLKATILHEIATNVFDYAKHFPDSERAKQLARQPGAAITVAEQLRTWIDAQAGTVTPETWDEYEKDVRNKLIPLFGEKRLTELKVSDVKAWAGKCGLSKKRIDNILIPLRGMYEAALGDASIESNPMLGLKIKLQKVETEEELTSNADTVDPLEPSEVDAICNKSTIPGFVNLVRFWAWSGLRTGEIVGLMWQDIDWHKGVVRVTRAVREKRVKRTKTPAGAREVKLLPAALAALEAQKPISFLAGKRVWLNPRTGEPWAGDGAIRKTAWVYALKAAGVRYRGPNQLRHTYASWMLSAGENPLWVANQMGHKDWGMIIRIYGRWIPSVDVQAGQKAAEMIAMASAQRR